MGKTFLAAVAVVGAGALLVACGQKAAEGPSAEELRSELAGITEELNAYMDEHRFSNTDPGTFQGAVGKFAEKFGALAGRAGKLRADTKDPAYDEVVGLAGEGRDKAGALAAALAAGAPMGDAAKEAALNDAIGDWADYNDRVGAPEAPPGDAEPVPPPVVGEPAPPPGVGEPAPPGVGEPAPPGVGEPAPAPGEPGVPPEPGEPGEPGGAPRYPGKGHHYGWWKNPEWARDRGTRPLPEGDVPGVGEKERKRERDRTGKSTGPERKRKREHVAPGAGEAAGPGAGAAPGGAGAGKGAGKGKGKGKGADAAPGGAAGGQ
jgi:hypothetical protein